jgi:hypothetical protein
MVTTFGVVGAAFALLLGAVVKYVSTLWWYQSLIDQTSAADSGGSMGTIGEALPRARIYEADLAPLHALDAAARARTTPLIGAVGEPAS